MTDYTPPQRQVPQAAGRGKAGSDDIGEEQLSVGEIKSRAAAGSVLLAVRSALINLFGFSSTLVLAHLLVRSDFGLVAIGFMVIGVGGFLADSGIAMGLVRRAAAPTRQELRSITGFQLLVSVSIATFATLASLVIGGSSFVTALMAFSMPILALRTPGLVYLDRQLDYRIRVRVELGETAAYFVWVCSTAAVGWGAWSIASAVVVKAIVGVALVMRMTPLGVIWPSFRLAPIRPLLRFGLRFQGLSAVQVLHDTTLSAGIGAIGGLGVLGLWSLCGRVLLVPSLLFNNLWNISIPAYARLLHAGEDLGALVERSVVVLAIAGGFVLAVLAGCGGALMPVVFGAKWNDVALILPGACLALAVSAPINISMMAAVYAAGDSRTPLMGSMVHGIFRLPLSLIGLHFFGVGAIGVGWLIGQLVEIPFVLPRIHAHVGRPVGRKLPVPVALTTLSGALGMALVSIGGTGVAGLVLSAAGTAAAFLLMTRIADPVGLAITRQAAASVVRHSLQRMRSPAATASSAA